jgi:hypothetical protein
MVLSYESPSGKRFGTRDLKPNLSYSSPIGKRYNKNARTSFEWERFDEDEIKESWGALDVLPTPIKTQRFAGSSRGDLLEERDMLRAPNVGRYGFGVENIEIDRTGEQAITTYTDLSTGEIRVGATPFGKSHTEKQMLASPADTFNVSPYENNISNEFSDYNPEVKIPFLPEQSLPEKRFEPELVSQKPVMSLEHMNPDSFDLSGYERALPSQMHEEAEFDLLTGRRLDPNKIDPMSGINYERSDFYYAKLESSTIHHDKCTPSFNECSEAAISKRNTEMAMNTIPELKLGSIPAPSLPSIASPLSPAPLAPYSGFH